MVVFCRGVAQGVARKRAIWGNIRQCVLRKSIDFENKKGPALPENQAITRLFLLELPSGFEPLTRALRTRARMPEFQYLFH